MNAVQRQIDNCRNGYELISVSLNSLDFGTNFTVQYKRGALTMFRQILMGLEKSQADIAFLVEHDILYHPSHFEFVPPRKDVFYYNINVIKLDAANGRTLKLDDYRQQGTLCGYRDFLIQHYRRRVALVEKNGFSMQMGFEPGTHRRDARVDDFGSDVWKSEFPNIDIRHKLNMTPTRWKKEQFRNQRYTAGWTEGNYRSIPGWDVALIEGLLNGLSN